MCQALCMTLDRASGRTDWSQGLQKPLHRERVQKRQARLQVNFALQRLPVQRAKKKKWKERQNRGREVLKDQF